MRKKRFTIVTLGCAKNLVDSEIIAGIMEKNGYTFTGETNHADILAINTCGFITPAIMESIEAILEAVELKKKNGKIKILVCGCLSERYKENLIRELPEVDFFAGVNDIENILKIIEGREKPFSKIPYIYSHKTPRKDLSLPHIKYVKIAEGCSHKCSFCVIPYIKGPYRSREIGDIVDEVKKSVDEGKREIILISQDSGYYGKDIYKKPSLHKLLKELDKIEGNFWIRVLYINPQYLNEKLGEAFKNSTHICPYFDIPFQHASKKILKLMKRKGDVNSFLEKIKLIREKIPTSTIRSTIIVGFPGESDEDFEILKNFLIKARMDFVGFFPYYDEEGTSAFTLKNKVSSSTTRKRISQLQKIQKKIMKEIYKEKFKNKVFDVIVDGYAGKDKILIEGRTSLQAPEIDSVVFLTRGNIEKLKVGKLYKVKIKRYLYPDMGGWVI